MKEGQCALCGAFSRLTGEHKIKASLLRSEFKSLSTTIAGIDTPKTAQGPKSKHFHFKKALICTDCNSSRTQPADRAFDQLHYQLKRLRDAGHELTERNNRPKFRFPANIEKDSFRYFAKLLCCFLVEVGGPRSRRLSSFAIGRSERNPIFLSIRRDSEYEAYLNAIGSEGLVRHGGLLFRFDPRKRWVNAIESSLSAGGVRYDFWMHLTIISRIELHFYYRDLIKVALDNIIELGTNSDP